MIPTYIVEMIMGKPSSTRLSRSQSCEMKSRIKRRLSNHKMNVSNRKKVTNKKKFRKTNKNIKKLFEQMRNYSCVTLDSSIDNTVILNDTTQECNTSTSNKKRKLESSTSEPNKCIRLDVDDVDGPRSVRECNYENDVQIVESVSEMNVITNIDKKNFDVIITDSNDNDVIITNSNLIKKRTNDISKTDDVIEIDSAQSTLKTPQKQLRPPMNCSTPISKICPNIMLKHNSDVMPDLNDPNATKEINRDSYLTIDLTTDTDKNRSDASKSQLNTVIDLDDIQDSQDCSLVSISNASLSMTGESDVTVINTRNSRNKVDRFVNGIAKLDASEKGRLLEMITQQIFNGCKVPQKMSNNFSKLKETVNRQTETVEHSYIKEVILGQKPSRNSIGSNIYNPTRDRVNKTGLRMIVIDGSNVAMTHSQGRVFSVRALQICIDYFVKRGHVVKAFVPRFRCKFGKSSDPRLLDDLEQRGLVVYTPSREIKGRNITPYDDRYIIQCAAEFDAVIVTGDNYKDLYNENPRWRFVIENRLLPFTWVEDMIMFPRDPLGRNGPTLDEFLRHPIIAPMPPK